MNRRPERSEAPDYFSQYIEQVPNGNIRQILESQSTDMLALIESVSEAQSLHHYARDKVEHARGPRSRERHGAGIRLPGVLVRSRIGFHSAELRSARRGVRD